MEAVILETRVDGITLINGKEYMTDAKGAFVPLSMVKPQHKLEDETVRKIIDFAVDLNAQIARFRGHTMTDLGSLDALIAQEYNAKIGGAKGNRTYQTIDGLMKVQVQVSEQIDFGSELQVAKSIIDECLTEWSADSRAEIQSIITRAFNTDQEGIHERMAGVVIENLPWQKVIERYDRPGTLFYLDPPYWGNEDDYGRAVFSRSDFEAMAEVLGSLRGRFILSLNAVPGVFETFSKFQIEEVDCTYSVAGGGHGKAVKEVLISTARL